MKTIHNFRLSDDLHGTFGLWVMPEYNVSFWSLERRWVLNKPFVSCIPPGEYIVKWTKSKKFRRFTYQIMNVKGRWGIRIHVANFMQEIEGCTALGMDSGFINGKRAILESRQAVEDFEELMAGEDFKLIIHDI